MHWLWTFKIVVHQIGDLSIIWKVFHNKLIRCKLAFIEYKAFLSVINYSNLMTLIKASLSMGFLVKLTFSKSTSTVVT